MNKFISTGFLLLASTNVLACNIPVGKYKLMTESHWGVNLLIKQNNIFQVMWGAYSPGKPNSLEIKSFSGHWSCPKEGTVFKYNLEDIQAEYKTSINYPYGVYKNQKAIIFSGKPIKGKYLQGYSFWPVKEF